MALKTDVIHIRISGCKNGSLTKPVKMCVEVLMGPLGGLTSNFPSPRLSKFCETFPVGTSPCKCTCMVVVHFSCCVDFQQV